MQRLSDPPGGGTRVPVFLDRPDDEPDDVVSPLDLDLLEAGDDLRAAIESGPSDWALTRRAFLRRGGAAAAAIVAGSGLQLLVPSRALAHGTIEAYPGVWGQKTVYEVTGNLASFGYRPSFHDRMSSWMKFWYDNTPSNFLKPIRVWSYGVHTDTRPSVAHNNGRGFDLSRIYATGLDGKRHRRFFGRYDIWKDWPADSRRAERRRYWATSASAHHHFQHVLTYLYDAAHHNHIHMDNLVSGSGNSSFDTGSEAQVLHVQACCRYIWGKSTAIDGVWGPQTRRHSTEVLRRIGRESGTIASSKANWLAFNTATLRKGYGTQSY